MNLLIECTASSQCGGERSNPQAEARNGEPMSRNIGELDSASLRYSRVAKLPEMLKPATGGEETFVCSRRTLRGGWRWRVGKDSSRNLRSPAVCRVADGLVVAKKRLINVEQRGADCMCVKMDVLQPLSLWLIKGNRAATNIAKKSNSNEEHTGEPDAGKPHVRFDEGCRRERHCIATAARRAYSTG
jgi:hypothetical protein